MNKVIIMRGIPGSGKTYNVNRIKEEHSEMNPFTCSTDHYWHRNGNGYNFDINLLGIAHIWNMRNFLYQIQNRKQLIIVDNTNVQVHEYTPYLQVALASDYEVEIVEIVTPFEVCLERQTHNVPKSTMKSMYNRFQEVLPWHKEYLTVIKN